MKVYVLTAGGSGGHIFPAISLSKEISKNGHKAILITDERGKRFISDFSFVHMLKLRHKSGILKKAIFSIRLLIEIKNCIFFLKKLKPQAVIGFGGYASFPAMIAAQILRIPTVIHEQNAIMGKANKYLSYGTNAIATSFNVFSKKSILTGNPVRDEFLNIKSYKKSKSKFNLLVLGGSQGAGIFSKVIPKALLDLPENIQKKISIYQQCRSELLDKTKAEYKDFKGKIELFSFKENIYNYFEKSHFIIARSGASTISELCVSGRPSLLVPYPSAKINDQKHNANWLHKKNGCMSVDEFYFTIPFLKKLIENIIYTPDKLLEIIENAKKQAIPNAKMRLLDLVYKVS